MPRVHNLRWTLLRNITCSLSLAGILFVALAAVAQTPQNRYQAYSTYLDPDPSIQIHEEAPIIAANANGEVCVETVYFLLRINPDGTLAYSEAISSLAVLKNRGGLLGIAIDSAGNCYLASEGSIAPTPGAYQSDKSFGMYVVKFDPQGKTVFATYMGGSGNDQPTGMALDPSGNIWLTGTTASNDFPVTSNAIQSSFQGGENDAFIVELNPTGTKLLYGTYLGGSNSDSSPNFLERGGIAIDSSGNVYVCGTTLSTNFPVLNALEPTLGGANDAFVTKISNSGTLLYSTYLGQSGDAASTGIAVDSAGEAFVIGRAFSGFPLVNPIPGQVPSAFVAKLNSADSALIYSTFFGLSPTVSTFSLQLDSQGNLSVAGAGGPIPLLNAIQTGSDNIPFYTFLADLDPNGNLIFSSYVGTSGGEEIRVSLGMDSNSSVYVGSATFVTYSPPLLLPIYGTYFPFCIVCEDEPFLAKVALGTGASFSMPTAVQFNPILMGYTEGPVVVTLFNTGTTDIAINNVTTTGDYSLTVNSCPATLTAGTQCNLSVSFTPTAGGICNGTIVVADNSPGNPHIIQLAGNGLAPSISVSPTTLTFVSQGLNTTSPAQKVMVTNTGTALLSISQIAITGTNAGDFAEINTCGLGIDAGTSCTISVTFTPTALGARTGTLTITDALGMQSVGMTGTGVMTLGLGIPSGGSSSATVSAGSTAKYTLAIGGGGISGAATLTCTGAPAKATCTVPSSENVSATKASTFTVSVSTTAPSSATLQHRGWSFAWFWATTLIGMVWLPLGRKSRRFAGRTAAILSLLLVTFLASCGGGNGGGGGSPSGGTPTGTYTLTVKATVGSTTQSQTLKLTVQ